MPSESVYIGHSNQLDCEYEVYIHNEALDVVKRLPDCYGMVKHSPTGVAWGYAGSGPAQLAFALLYDATGKEHIARKWYMKFKAEVVSRLEPDFKLSISEIGRWLLNKQQEEAMGPRPESECVASIFRHHNCWRCDSGAKPCIEGDYSRCSYPQARND